MSSNIEDKILEVVEKIEVEKMIDDGAETICNFKNDCSGFEIKSLTIREFNKKLKAGKINSNAAYQRGLKASWLNPKYRAAVLDSIMRGFSIGAIYVVELEDGTWELIDGKQRSNFIGITLNSIQGFEGMEDEGLNKYFNEWTEDDQKVFLDYKIPFIVFNGMEDSDRRLQFERLSSGVKLTKLETRRGLILNVVNLPSLKEVVNTILKIMPIAAGREAVYESAEEIVLQSLSFVVSNNSDFKGYPVIKTLKAADSKKINAAVKIIGERAAALSLMVEDDQDNNYKWLLKKCALNSLLCVNTDDDGQYNTVRFASFKKLANQIAGQDQIDFKNFSANSTANSVNVLGRIEILKKIQSGLNTKNIEKEVKVKEAKKEVKGFGLGKDSNPSYNLPEDKSDQFSKTWGKDIASVELINQVCKYVTAKGGSLKSVRALKSIKGDNQFSYAVQGKIFNASLDVLPGIEEVKVNQSVVNIR